jgi:hypothetical protein
MSALVAFTGDCSAFFLVSALLVPKSLILAIVGSCVQILFAIYFGWRSMNNEFWEGEGKYARAGFVLFLALGALQICLNNRDFPVWMAYGRATESCAAIR